MQSMLFRLCFIKTHILFFLLRYSPYTYCTCSTCLRQRLVRGFGQEYGGHGADEAQDAEDEERQLGLPLPLQGGIKIKYILINLFGDIN